MTSLFKLPRRALQPPGATERALGVPERPSLEDDEPTLRLGRKTKAGKGEDRAQRVVPRAMKQLHSLLRQSAGRGGGKAMGGRGRMPPGAPFGAQALQRVAVRATYTNCRTAGQWAAHGRYLERESANGTPGFDAQSDAAALSQTLDTWQKAGDPRLWKLIISPENPGMDLRDFTRDYMKQLAADLGVGIEWIAQDHYNTDQPHVHVALRGVDAQGRELRIDPDYIKRGLRLRAQQEATRRLGLRTERDVLMAAERDVAKSRFTDLDRRLKGHAMRNGGIVDYSEGATNAMDVALVKRLAHLERMGLAERAGERRWRLVEHMESALRQRQVADDRLKVMHAHRAVASDPRAPLRAAAVEKGAPVRGRLIATGADDANGRPYLLVESPAGEVLYLMQNDRTSEARHKGLKIGDFVELSIHESKGRDRFAVRSLGDAESLAADRVFMREEAKRYVEQRQTLPPPSVFGGWIGKYQSALHEAGRALDRVNAVDRAGDAATLREPGRRGPGRTSP